ncbi:C-type lectin domain family 1 member A-like, partial [Alligator sinensis]|uniref:C-type lectin domain family 1 member A-like n=1 Tax=Alligator sinensis TaxID=38654 RepID=A0A3Q0FQ44_ALLSI
MQRQTHLPAGQRVSPTASSSWLPLALALGAQMLCLLLMIGLRVYDAMVTEICPKSQSVTQLPTSCPNQTPCLPGTPEEQPRDTGEKCPVQWVVHKDSSCLFSPEKGTWEQCHSSCISQSAQLLTIEDGEELDFIKKESFHYFEDHDGVSQYYTFWIGLSYDPGSGKWVWADDLDLSSGLFDLQDLSLKNDQDRVCAYIHGGRAKAGGICRETHFCICEKRRKES